MKTGSAYRAAFVSAEPIGTSNGGSHVTRGIAPKYHITYRTALDGEERAANTRGFVDPMLRDLNPGDRVNLIRDGRGSIIHIEKVS